MRYAVGFILSIIIASAKVGATPVPDETRLSEKEVSDRAPNFSFPGSLHKRLSEAPVVIIKTSKKFDYVQLCYASVVMTETPSIFTHGINEKYIIWDSAGPASRIVLRFVQGEASSLVEIYTNAKTIEKFINRIAICSGTAELSSDQ